MRREDRGHTSMPKVVWRVLNLSPSQYGAWVDGAQRFAHSLWRFAEGESVVVEGELCLC